MKFHLLAVASKQKDSTGRMMRELKDFGSTSELFDLLNAYRIHEDGPEAFLQDYPNMFLTEALAFRVWDALGEKTEEINFDTVYKLAKSKIQSDESLQALLDQSVADIIQKYEGVVNTNE